MKFDLRRYRMGLAVGALAGAKLAACAVVDKDRFRDCAECPEMVVVPAGTFVMGTPAAEAAREDVPDHLAARESPQHEVRIRAPFALGRFAVTLGEFRAFVRATGHEPHVCSGASGDPRDGPYFRQTERHPVVCVSFKEALRYAAWLAKKTGKRYRLASEAEWEYAARAGTATARFWGEGWENACAYANGADISFRRGMGSTRPPPSNCSDGYVHTAPVGALQPNPFGLYDMLGNVWQWVEDCWNDTYQAAPNDGKARITGDCRRHVLRGGSWIDAPWVLRSGSRNWLGTYGWEAYTGFRVARTLTP